MSRSLDRLDLLPPTTADADADADTSIQYRELSSDEIKTLEGIFAATGNPLPSPTLSTFVGALQGGKVVGFLVLQARLHAEPMWIAEGHSQIFTSLVSAAEKTILKKSGPQWVYLFAPAGKLSQLAQNMGMALEPWCVLSKLVQPELPHKIGVDMLPIDATATAEEGTIQ